MNESEYFQNIALEKDRLIDNLESVVENQRKELEVLHEIEKQIIVYFKTENATDNEETINNIVAKRMILQLLRERKNK